MSCHFLYVWSESENLFHAPPFIWTVQNNHVHHQENTEELKQHMARVGDKAQRILCSLSFRAWALTLAEDHHIDVMVSFWNGWVLELLLWFVMFCYFGGSSILYIIRDVRQT